MAYKPKPISGVKKETKEKQNDIKGKKVENLTNSEKKQEFLSNEYYNENVQEFEGQGMSNKKKNNHDDSYAEETIEIKKEIPEIKKIEEKEPEKIQETENQLK